VQAIANILLCAVVDEFLNFLICIACTQAIFIAYGPAFKKKMVIDEFEAIELYNLLAGQARGNIWGV